ncbi:GNAT family N-acetyltransferase [Actinoplanes sp. LDG1-06]|uniref:GNAT family N-acetyltransferase n=1 Tax=Paractinoplanes ovalisporus TaxID=2810368 RepID=A0ABS2A2K3_9ACTN|nr:GNAT family N-acetyltransferase [Actinoplanes ovalisporus]MBM2614055.1 GNAT family N-acetyltransferase [Actinoplanes ovalisporus]
MHDTSTASSLRAFRAALDLLASSRRRSHLRSRPRQRPAAAPALGLGEAQIFMVAANQGRRSTGSVPDGLALVRRLASDEYETFADVIGRAFDVPAEEVARVYTAEVLANPLIGAYVAETGNGTPVAAGVGIVQDGHLGIANVGTVPAFRRQGYARVLTETILRRGALAGAHTAYLHAGDTTAPFFERLGFTARTDSTMPRAS